MKKSYFRNVLNEGYATGSRNKKYAVTSTYGQNTQTKIVNSWSDAENNMAHVIAMGEDVISVYEVGAKVKIPDVSKKVIQVRRAQQALSDADGQ